MVVSPTVPDNLSAVENLRRELEESLTKLRASLRYWQTWEAEYEGLKEEVERLPREAKPDDVVRAFSDSSNYAFNNYSAGSCEKFWR